VQPGSPDALRGVLAAGVRSWRAGWPSLVLASLVLGLASAPIQWFSFIFGTALQRISAVGVELHQHPSSAGPSPEQASELGSALASCCGSSLGGLVLSVVLLAPTVAGATMLGAQVARGASTRGALGAGFRRYWATVWVGALCLVLGGGASVIASAVASAGARLGFMAASDLTGEVMGLAGELSVWGLLLVLALSLVWGSARLWLALYRLVDPSLPRVSGAESLRWSWRRTAGPVQWRIVGVMVTVSVVAGVVQVPFEWMATQPGTVLGTVGRFASPVVAVTLWVPWALACSGHVYARLAPR